MADYADMDAKKHSKYYCNDKINRISFAVSVISLALAALLFVKVDIVNRKAESIETKIENRVQRMEDDMDATLQRVVQEMLQSSDAIPTTGKSIRRNDAIADVFNNFEGDSGHRHKNRRSVAQASNAPTVSLQHVRQEIDKKLSQVCTAKDKLCQVGPQGPPGDPGAHGYPGYKGEKEAPGITGPHGPLGPTGAQGPSGKQGRQGPQGIKGEKGQKGSAGPPGVTGDVGAMGRPGEKGSIGFKGAKGSRGAMGLRGPKGQLVVSRKIRIFPVSQEVSINQSAVFYCWVDGHTTSKTTWRKLGGASIDDVKNSDVLHIKNVKRSHAGSYSCSVFTGYGIFRAISTLEIREPPIFTKKPPSQVFADLGSTLTLCCEAGGSVSWTREERSLKLLSAFQQHGCLTISSVNEESAGKYTCRATNNFGFSESTSSVIVTVGTSCAEALSKRSGRMKDGEHYLKNNNQFFKAYCDVLGWTLIARFSNKDHKNWMDDQGTWWYDRHAAVGNTTDPTVNTDMISPAFWLTSGRELKITRSDDPSHTPLLQTMGNCLAGKTFRSKITSYGDFRDGKVWASNRCRGSCVVKFGGQYQSTQGFYTSTCNGNLQNANRIGFWCDGYDGSVMMIGGGGKGGGSGCSGADHGIGITEANEASFIYSRNGYEAEYDFGYDARTKHTPSKYYSLNLWIR